MATRGRPPAPTSGGSISVEEIDHLRSRVFRIVSGRMEDVQSVLQGRKKWDAIQTKLYLAMLDKVMPNLTHTHRTTEDITKPLDQMTDDELRAFIAESKARAEKAAELPPIEHIPTIADSFKLTPAEEAELERLEAIAKEIK